ncbi:ribulose-phosphate 3-epimerase [Thermosulfidibacter takaii ABI70S6]|uniref:Ribulose-phosphate 3-epimerase n=1 Tax=Thermosulfidibacter takaii (strain DSM 17441 / JCM 13301 / NBRC 103674 / ABI70S6) TaxID=1298851 RepID=A0A0S3QW77_THET7|nr:ribulose-phosphate 3-epimerase [Thermosulfidibacter takaii]BAT72558.1 ribulose-phosphate 3-epimerase [Thermosulfidibacter takaii ABI70S6]
MIKISPSILSADFWRLGEQIRKVEEGGADYLHIDVMDGHFVPNISIGIPVVKSIKGKTRLPLDVHIMVDNPEVYAPKFVEAGANILTFHVEATPHPNRVIQSIKALGAKAGIVLNPTTPLSTLEYILQDVDIVLLMSVNPGFGGQKFLPFVLKKIEKLREMIDSAKLKVEIEVDGGIGPTNIKDVAKAGANVIVAGSSVFSADDPAERVRLLKRLGEEALKDKCSL